jgi:putative transposase
MTFWRTSYHIVWATKYRQPLITPAVEESLYAHIRQKAAECKCHIFAINACIDHIHVVLSIPPSVSVADIVHGLKGASSHEFEHITWQRGYGVFTVGERQRKIAIQYVRNQKQHHADKLTNTWLEHTGEPDQDETEIREIPPVYETEIDSLI